MEAATQCLGLGRRAMSKGIETTVEPVTLFGDLNRQWELLHVSFGVL